MARPIAQRSLTEPGQRDRVITLQQRTESIGSSGAPIETWSTLVADVPAYRRMTNGRERFLSDQHVASTDTVFEIAYRDDMDSDLVNVAKDRRVLFHSRVYDIVAVEEIGLRSGLSIMTLANPARTS